MPVQNKTYCQDESGNYGKTIWQYRWPTDSKLRVQILTLLSSEGKYFGFIYFKILPKNDVPTITLIIP